MESYSSIVGVTERCVYLYFLSQGVIFSISRRWKPCSVGLAIHISRKYQWKRCEAAVLREEQSAPRGDLLSKHGASFTLSNFFSSLDVPLPKRLILPITRPQVRMPFYLLKSPTAQQFINFAESYDTSFSRNAMKRKVFPSCYSSR